jgi:hypothetical protein
MNLLEKLAGGPLTFGRAVESVRKSEGLSKDACAKRLGVSKSHLCDVEKGRKTVSPHPGYPRSPQEAMAVQSPPFPRGFCFACALRPRDSA